MSQNASSNTGPCVMATNNLPAAVSGHCHGHSSPQPLPTPSSGTSRSPVIITANITNTQTHPGGVSPVVMHKGHRRTSSDASSRRHQFYESIRVNTPAFPNSPPSVSEAASASLMKGSMAAKTTSPQPHSQLASSANGNTSCEPDAKDKFSSSDTSLESEVASVEMRRKKNYPLRHCQSEFVPGLELDYPASMVDAKEHAIQVLMKELDKAQKELALKTDDCDKLSQVRTQMESEVTDLTAQLFEAANKMVQDAEGRRHAAEKKRDELEKLSEDLLQQVEALKFMVLNSTSRTSSHHINPQLNPPSPSFKDRLTKKSHRRSTSHHDFTKESRERAEQEAKQQVQVKEIDDVCYDEFQRWKNYPDLLAGDSPFLQRLYHEDVQPCLNFNNRQLVDCIVMGAKQNTLFIEPIKGDNSLPRSCSLTNKKKLCYYNIKLDETDSFHPISNMCRNRVIAVVELYQFLGYICKNLIRWSDKDMFIHLNNLRLKVAQARLDC